MIKNKKAKRLLAGVLGMATLLVVFLVGCGKKDDNLKDNKYIKVLPERIKDDEYIICANTYNMNIVDGISSYTSVGLKVLSDKPIESKDVNEKWRQITDMKCHVRRASYVKDYLMSIYALYITTRTGKNLVNWN